MKILLIKTKCEEREEVGIMKMLISLFFIGELNIEPEV